MTTIPPRKSRKTGPVTGRTVSLVSGDVGFGFGGVKTRSVR